MSKLVKKDPWERIERIDNSLAPGTFWRALEDDPQESDGFKNYLKGKVYLVADIKDVDGVDHTVVVRRHPEDISRRYSETFDILVSDFLQVFKPAHNHKQIRQEEMAGIQAKIDTIARKMHEASANPQMLEAYVREELEKKGAKGPTLALIENTPEDDRQMVALTAAQGVSTAVVQQMREELEAEAEVAKIKGNWFSVRADEMKNEMQRMAPYFTEQAHAELAKTSRIRKKVDKILQGLQSVDLYLGKGVEVITILEGEPAPVDSQFVLYQRRLYVDEEVSVFTAFDDGEFDYTDANSFFEELKKTPELVKQIMPFERGVVLLSWRRTSKDYESAWEYANKNAVNLSSWLFLKNGENLYLVDSPEVTHSCAKRLFPIPSELDKIFSDWENNSINFDDLGYADRKAKFDQRMLHYKRFAILLTGLQDREQLLGEFTINVSPAKLMNPDVQKKVFRFIHDEENVLGTGMPDYKTWLADKNKYMQPGSRVCVSWRDVANEDSCPAIYSTSYSARDGELIAHPREDRAVVIPCKRKERLVVKMPAARSTWSSDAHFNATVDLHKAYYGFMCLDLVKSEDLYHYIHDRTQREHYFHYIGLFKMAYTHLQEVEKHEASLRAYLIEALEVGAIGSAGERNELVNQAIAAWRARHNGKMTPLPGDEQYSQVCQKLLNQMYVIAGEGRDRVEAALSALEPGRTPLRLAVTGNSKLYLYAALSEEEGLNQPILDNFVKRYVLEEKKTKISIVDSAFDILLEHNARENVLHEWDAAAEHYQSKIPKILYRDIGPLFDNAKGCMARVKDVLEKGLDFETTMGHLRQVDLLGKKYIQYAKLIIPIGVGWVWSNYCAEHKLVQVGLSVNPIPHLYTHGSRAEREKLHKWFVSRFAHREAGERSLERNIKTDTQTASVVLIEKSEMGFLKRYGGYTTQTFKTFDPVQLNEPQEWGKFQSEKHKKTEYINCWEEVK